MSESVVANLIAMAIIATFTIVINVWYWKTNVKKEN